MGRPELPPPLPRCDERAWDSVGSVCEDCKVVVTDFRTRWGGKCLNYCGAMGFRCINAWESQVDDTCGSSRTIPCDVDHAVTRTSTHPVDPGGYEDQHGVCRCEPPPANVATVSVSLAVTIEQYEHNPVQFTENFAQGMAETLGVATTRIIVIAVFAGSVQVDFLLLPPSDNEAAVQAARGEPVVSVDDALRVLADPRAMEQAAPVLRAAGLGDVTVLEATPPSHSSSCGVEYRDNFVSGSLDGWSSSVGVDVLATMTCGGLGEILGGYNILGAGAWLEKAFDLSESPHLTATVSLTFVKIDSWDGERAMVLVDGNEVWADSFGWEDTGTQHCGRQEDNWHEVDHEVGPLLVSHFADTLTLRVTTTLDQQAGDESFGIANVAVSTGPQCGHGTCIESGSDGAATPSCSCQFGWSGDGCSVAVLGECQGASPSAGFVQDRFDGGDIRGWSSSIAQNLGTTHCGALGELLGGFGLLGSGDWLEKTYADLPTHSSVSLQLVFVKVDSWDGERGIVLVDGREIWSRAFVVREGSQHCGGELGWHERDYQVGPLSIDHVARSLTLRVTTTLNQGAQDESFGISDVLIEVLC